MTIDLILGTAGHIDHGKTSLVRALTGVDLDRLPEEQQRGITIELGFAELLLGDYRLGIVDVPGHERFVRNMLAGATGPLGAALLLRRNNERDWLVVNTALYMSINHAVRLAAFIALGFSFAPWWRLTLGLVVAVTLGSWLGTRLRGRVSQVDFRRWFRLLVTLLALRMIALPFLP